MQTVLSQAEKLIQSRMADLSVDRKMLEHGVDFGHSADVKRVLSRLSIQITGRSTSNIRIN
jgi:hypothetical protein